MFLSSNDIPDHVGLFPVIRDESGAPLTESDRTTVQAHRRRDVTIRILQDANTLRIESTGLLIFQGEASASLCQPSETVMAELPNLSCVRCGHKWIARRNRRPFACPRCQSTCWDEPAVALSRFRLSKLLSSKNGEYPGRSRALPGLVDRDY